VTAAGWSATTQFVGVTPSCILGSAFDSPTLVNVTFNYTGPVLHGNNTTINIGGFQIISSFGGSNTSGTFTSQSTKDVGGSIGNTDQLVGPVTVPAALPSTTPEPVSFSLIGLGLSGIALCYRRKKK
jgi:hypothetical protein